MNPWHTPRPGPVYWDGLCLRCGERVDHHPPRWRRLLRKVRKG